MTSLKEALIAKTRGANGRPLVIVERTPEERRELFVQKNRANSRRQYRKKKEEEA
jgi:hypothetical protein